MILKFENKSDTEIDQLNFNLKHYEKCKFTITLHKEFELDWFILDKITL